MKRNLIEVDAARPWYVLSGRGFLNLSVCRMLLAMLCSPVWAQVGAASLSGLVQDTTGASIPGATVTIQNTASGAQRHLQSNSAGDFAFSAVPSGDYKVTVEHAGFKQLVRTGVHLNAGDSLALTDLQLTVGDVSQSITVSTTTASLPLDSGQLSSTITSERHRAGCRSWGAMSTELESILPGFAIRNLGSTNAAPDFSQVQIGQPTPYASNGSPVAGITLKLDGASLTDAGSFGAALMNINDSFVSEVQVQTSNFGADQSNGPVVIQGVTKSGTDKYHGSPLHVCTHVSAGRERLAGELQRSGAAERPLHLSGRHDQRTHSHTKKVTFFAGAEYDAQRNIYAYGSSGSAIIHALVPTAGAAQWRLQSNGAGQFSRARGDERELWHVQCCANRMATIALLCPTAISRRGLTRAPWRW